MKALSEQKKQFIHCRTTPPDRSRAFDHYSIIGGVLRLRIQQCVQREPAHKSKTVRCVLSPSFPSPIKSHHHFHTKIPAINTNSAGKKPTEMAAVPSLSSGLSGAIVVSASCTAAVPI